MSVKYERFKNFICILLCAACISGTFLWGNNLATTAQGFISGVGDRSLKAASYSDNKNAAEGTTAQSVSGYGGGGYVTQNASVIPSDVESLAKELEPKYKNYKKSGNIKEVQMGASSSCESFGIIDVNNKTDEAANIESLLNKSPQFGQITKSEPYILVYHTHTTEGYELLDWGWYSDEYISRTTDENKNMVRVGDELTATLEKAGYKVIHDRTVYDSEYNGAYDRSRVTVEKYLEKYPSIVLTLDVHRDAIEYDDATKCKPTALIKGVKAAQVMIITGCEGDGVENFPLWRQNLTFALHLQNAIQEKYEGLMRPVFFCNRKYNMNVTPCSLLLEFGTDANTLQEAVYSARLVGECIGDLLDGSRG